MEPSKSNSSCVQLISPAGLPFRYAVKLSRSSPGSSMNVSVINEDGIPLSGGIDFEFDSSDHQSCLDLYEQLSQQFGLRLPYNRTKPSAPSYYTRFNILLAENIAPGMIYGYGDPAVSRVQEKDRYKYYLAVTSNDAPDSFPILSSEDLIHWRFESYVFPAGHQPSWALAGWNLGDYWAPEIHKIGDEYRIYFVARDKLTNELCIGLAKALSPAGPYTPASEPLLTGNVIDPHVYSYGRLSWLFWKEDNNDVWPGQLLSFLFQHPQLVAYLFEEREDIKTCCFMLTIWPYVKELLPMERFQMTQVFIESITSRFLSFCKALRQVQQQSSPSIQNEIGVILQNMKTPMYAQKLSADGSTLVGEKTKIIENDLDWEAHLVEGMWVTHQNSKYYLFYAGNDFSTAHYGIGVAIASHPLGPYTKLPSPILGSTAEWSAPGHPSLTVSPAGKPLLMLHAFFPGEAGYKKFRALLSLELRFTDAGVEVVQ